MPRRGSFRKLDIRLPVQPVVRQRPWLIAGMLLALGFLTWVLVCYDAYHHRKDTGFTVPAPEKRP